jgi:hypothetical protein
LQGGAGDNILWVNGSHDFLDSAGGNGGLDFALNKVDEWDGNDIIDDTYDSADIYGGDGDDLSPAKCLNTRLPLGALSNTTSET